MMLRLGQAVCAAVPSQALARWGRVRDAARGIGSWATVDPDGMSKDNPGLAQNIGAALRARGCSTSPCVPVGPSLTWWARAAGGSCCSGWRVVHVAAARLRARPHERRALHRLLGHVGQRGRRLHSQPQVCAQDRPAQPLQEPRALRHVRGGVGQGGRGDAQARGGGPRRCTWAARQAGPQQPAAWHALRERLAG
jgi:hypothetical protein